MKVFGCKPQRGYSGGIILVAANDIQEAYKTFMKDFADKDIYFDYTDDWDGDPNDWDNRINNIFQFDKWQQYEKLTSNVTEPQILINEFYVE